LDAPKPDINEWFDLRRVVKLTIGDKVVWGVTTIISEAGAEIALTQNTLTHAMENTSINIEIAEEKVRFDAEIVSTGFNDEYPTIRVNFTSLSLEQHRHLVEILFCRPGQWKRNKTPGEFQSLLLIFRILLKPRIFFDRNMDVSPVIVAKV
jgi:cellulose synthase (UDP-forming)